MKVIKPFTTRLRRFKADDEVRRGDDLTPHTIEGLQAAEYVETPDKAAGGKKSARKA